MVEESLTLFKVREVLKWRTTLDVDSVLGWVGRFDCSTAVLKARELVISSAERREMSCGGLALLLREQGLGGCIRLACYH